MDAHAQSIFDTFVERKPLYLTLEKEARRIIDGILSDNHLSVVAVESRVKREKSLAGKLELKGYKYKDISDITDLVGLRIVTFYTEEVDRISRLLEDRFKVDWENSVDKRRLYTGDNNDRFGYQSLHYIVSLPESEYYDPEHPEINGLKCEIQVRTALQHIWATAFHDTGYKSDIEIPSRYMREMNQLAGLLEITDNSFSRILGEITEYRRNVSGLVANGDFDALTLDGDTFAGFMEIDPFRELNRKIAAINRSELVSVSYSNYLALFRHLGFSTIGDIVRMRDKYSDMAYRLALSQLGDTDIDILASTIGMQELCIVYIYENGGGIFGIKEFFDITVGKRDRNIQSAERTVKQLENVKVI